MNKCYLSGNLTRDPEVRTTTGGTSVANFGLAVKGRTKEDVIFFDVEAWSTGADFISKYFKKGDGIIIDGSLRQDSWNDKTTGDKRTKLVVRCDHCEFPPGKGNKKNDGAEETESAPEVNTNGKTTDDSDIPF